MKKQRVMILGALLLAALLVAVGFAAAQVAPVGEVRHTTFTGRQMMENEAGDTEVYNVVLEGSMRLLGVTPAVPVPDTPTPPPPVGDWADCVNGATIGAHVNEPVAIQYVLPTFVEHPGVAGIMFWSTPTTATYPFDAATWIPTLSPDAYLVLMGSNPEMIVGKLGQADAAGLMDLVDAIGIGVERQPSSPAINPLITRDVATFLLTEYAGLQQAHAAGVRLQWAPSWQDVAEMSGEIDVFSQALLDAAVADLGPYLDSVVYAGVAQDGAAYLSQYVGQAVTEPAVYSWLAAGTDDYTIQAQQAQIACPPGDACFGQLVADRVAWLKSGNPGVAVFMQIAIPHIGPDEPVADWMARGELAVLQWREQVAGLAESIYVAHAEFTPPENLPAAADIVRHIYEAACLGGN